MYPCSFSTWCTGLCGKSARSLENRGYSNFFHDLEGQGVETNNLRPVLVVTPLTWQNTRAMLCEVLMGARVLPDDWMQEHLPIRVITDCKSLFDCLAKDVSVPEDGGTALTVASLREGCSAGVGRDSKRSGLMWVPTRVQLADGLTKSSAGVFLRNALTS